MLGQYLYDAHLPDRVDAERVRVLQVVVGVGVQLQQLVALQRGAVVVVPPRRAEYVQALREYVVVYEARVHREQAHEQDDVATAEEYIPDLRRNVQR